MSSRVFNFYSGPAALPADVLERAAEEMLSFGGTGMSVMEISHRSDAFLGVLRSAERRLRDLLSVPDGYHILFMQGGASMQFSMVPMNFLAGGAADYVVTGTWSDKACRRAADFGKANVIADTYSSNGNDVPRQEDLRFTQEARYVHYVSNETIAGLEFDYDLDGEGLPVVCDASSNILSRPIDVEKYAMIYAGAQKNIGPSGVTVVIVRNDFLESAAEPYSGVLSYRSFADNESMPNTPNTWGVYIINLVCEWLQDRGGVEGIAKLNAAKADLLYSAIDSSDGFYTSPVARRARSRMNVTFRLPSVELEETFCRAAAGAGLVGLKGHRSVGGVRASIYNAMPLEGVEKLVDFMESFARLRR